LLRRAQLLADYVTAHADVSLKDLAFTLNTDFADGGSRLAVVAGTAGELNACLTRAAGRLAEAECRHINDSQGIYYFADPLHFKGKLAVLFTGEGSQYLNMLGDLLPHFPELRDHFARCDRLSLLAGRRSEPISQAILLPSDATPEERTAAEKELWRLHNAVGTVLMANWGVYHIVRQMIQADAFAGHSAGEISALAAAGCLEADDFLFAQLLVLGHDLQQQEDEGTVADTVLLAAGAGRQALAEVIEQAGPAVCLAMDNCPHQTVAAGPPEAMAAVEARLRARGVVCERLPFRRPYHTPLFEPLLDPIARMYEALPVRPARKPVYSCATGQPFPDDPESIRSLAVAHWASRVEFTRMIEAMYADGVRLFVESGPRGNLTAFVADILRGRPFAALAGNLQRRSGPTQLNHLAGQLAAHHVPLDLDCLYRHRDPRRVDWDVSLHVPVPPPVPGLASGNGIGNGNGHGKKGDVLCQYWDVMEQFLDVQCEVMEQFLARRGTDTLVPLEHSVPGTEYSESVRRGFPLLGKIVRHDPGRELVMRRRMDLGEDLYALDHTLGGRHASAFDPDHHGLPVMPMALSLEMMAEAAAILAPGKLLLGMDGVRLHRWIPFDDEPVTLEVTARVLPPGELGDQGADQVRVDVRDHGNATRPGNPEKPSVEGTVLFADHYPEPPPVDDFPLSNEGPCRYSVAQLYDEERRLFHGPTFQAVCSTDRHSEEGIEGHLTTLPHSGLFRSMPEPELLTDPLLIDSSTHVLGCWHLGQADQAGRVVLPYELGTVRLFGPRPVVGSRVKCRVRILSESARQVSHRIDLIGPDGRLWCRLDPAEYWRFYWPPEFVDFFRFKDVYLLGRPWQAVEVSFANTRARCLRLVPPPDLTQPVKRAAMAHVSLSRAEWQQFRTLNGPDKRITEWVFGRIVAKDAVRAFWQQRHGDQLYPADIDILPDEHGRPVARHRSIDELPAVSISHSKGVVAALAAFEPHVGIDLEPLRHRESGFEDIAFDAGERDLLNRCGFDRDEAIARLWCSKEAVGKALGRGLPEGPRSVTVHALHADGTALVALGPLLAAASPEFRVDLLIARTVRDGDFVVATTFCERANP
jgi:malonyl CoA-acyl carrier protein transacylase/phosphopantetheinyl transferase (holo-ACP synthase)